VEEMDMKGNEVLASFKQDKVYASLSQGHLLISRKGEKL
jgi:hypothetical protein